MKNRRLTNALLILLPLSAVVLLALPNCICMRFANPNGPVYEYVSGFSMLPPGYGNWGPMLAGITALVLVVLAVWNWVKSREKVIGWIFGWSLFGAGALALPTLLFGQGTILSWTAVALLGADAWLSYRIKG